MFYAIVSIKPTLTKIPRCPRICRGIFIPGYPARLMRAFQSKKNAPFLALFENEKVMQLYKLKK